MRAGECVARCKIYKVGIYLILVLYYGLCILYKKEKIFLCTGMESNCYYWNSLPLILFYLILLSVAAFFLPFPSLLV